MRHHGVASARSGLLIRGGTIYSGGASPFAGDVDEAIGIARAARIPVYISHTKALGVDVHGMAPAIIAKVEAARAEGLAITANQYPWEASGTSLAAALIPLWAQDGRRTALLKRLDDPALAERLFANDRAMALCKAQ